MQNIIGHYDSTTVSQLNQLLIQLKGGKLNLAWTLCDLTARFISNYFNNAYVQDDIGTPPLTPPVNGGRSDQQRLILEYTHSVSYIINELIENALKFRISGDISVKAGMLADQFCCSVSNIASKHSAGKLQIFLEEITTGDAQDLLLQRFEANAMDPNSNASGLGFLTMINDYGVKLGCKFETDHDQPERVLVETLITLPIL